MNLLSQLLHPRGFRIWMFFEKSKMKTHVSGGYTSPLFIIKFWALLCIVFKVPLPCLPINTKYVFGVDRPILLSTKWYCRHRILSLPNASPSSSRPTEAMKHRQSSDPSIRDPSHISRTLSPLAGTFLILLALFIHANYVTHHLSRHRLTRSLNRLSTLRTSSATSSSIFSQPYDPLHDDPNKYTPPPLFIYRRTKKSGSSSMLASLLPQLVAMNYVPFYYHRGEMDFAVRNEFIRANPRNLFIAEHNRIVRSHHPKGHAIIADTVRDGYEQMTSFCRYVQKVKSCNSELIKCLRSEATQRQLLYRWAGRESEDNETYIDLPLSSRHSALSTSVLRTVFPNITINIHTDYNRKFSTCPERLNIRTVYNELYADMEEQIDILRRRMLIIAGYPFTVDKSYTGTISIKEMMDAADALERKKYPDIGKPIKSGKRTSGYSDVHLNLRASTRKWYIDSNGKLGLTSRQPIPSLNSSEEE